MSPKGPKLRPETGRAVRWFCPSSHSTIPRNQLITESVTIRTGPPSGRYSGRWRVRPFRCSRGDRPEVFSFVTPRCDPQERDSRVPDGANKRPHHRGSEHGEDDTARATQRGSKRRVANDIPRMAVDADIPVRTARRGWSSHADAGNPRQGGRSDSSICDVLHPGL